MESDNYVTNMTTEETDDWKYGACEERTILLMGRARTGKSTIAGVLVSTLFEPKKLDIYSETRQTEIKHIFTTDKNTGKSYRFTIIDTPGFFDLTRDKSTRLDNNNIKEHIKDCLKSDIRHVHLFGIVFNLANGINERDIEAMIYIKQNFPGIEKHSALIITNCEQTNETERNRLIQEFYRHRLVQQHNLQKFFQQEVLFMGCLRRESIDTVNERAIYLEYNNVLDMRTAFIKKCIQCTDTYSFCDSVCSIM